MGMDLGMDLNVKRMQENDYGCGERPEIGLLCCGACNLSYDRDAIVRRLPELLPEAGFVAARSGTRYAALLVMHGCPIACTSEFNMEVPEERRVRMALPEEQPSALEGLRRIIGK